MLVLTSYPTLKLNTPSGWGLDKVAHFFVYFFWTILLYLSGILKKDIAVKWIIPIGMCISLLDEIHQIPIKGRFFSIYDFIADICGIVVAALTILLLRKRCILLQERNENE